MELTGLQKSVLVTGLALLLGGSGLLVYDRFNTSGDEIKTHPLLKQKLSDKAKKSLIEIREAEEYLRQNSRESAQKAMVIFNRVLAQNHNPSINQISRFGLGVALERMDDRAAALEHYRILKNEDITDPALAERVDYRLGKVLLEINHEEEGRSLLEKTLSSTRDNKLKSDIHTAYGNYYLKRNDRQRARENYTIALKYNPDNLNAELLRAQATRKDGKYRQAYDYYDDYLVGASNLDPEKRSDVVEDLRKKAYESGIVAYRSGKYREAVMHFNKVVSSYPDSEYSEKSYYWLGESYERLNDSETAIKMYDRVLKNANLKMDQPALIKKGIIQYKTGDLEDALRSFSQAVDEFPTGEFAPKAREWKEETMSQIREQSILRSYSLDDEGVLD